MREPFFSVGEQVVIVQTDEIVEISRVQYREHGEYLFTDFCDDTGDVNRNLALGGWWYGIDSMEMWLHEQHLRKRQLYDFLYLSNS